MLAILITGVLAWFLQNIGPWWLFGVLVVVVVITLKLRPWQGFVIGFVAIAICWGVTAGWVDIQNHSLLSERIGEVMGGLSSTGLILLTALVGGIVGGFCGLTGGLAHQYFVKEAEVAPD